MNERIRGQSDDHSQLVITSFWCPSWQGLAQLTPVFTPEEKLLLSLSESLTPSPGVTGNQSWRWLSPSSWGDKDEERKGNPLVPQELTLLPPKRRCFLWESVLHVLARDHPQPPSSMRSFHKYSLALTTYQRMF